MEKTSLFAMVQQAGAVGQLVLFVLMVFSLITWAIIIHKYFVFRTAHEMSQRFLDVFWSSRSLDVIFAEAKKLSQSPSTALFQAGYTELQKLVEFRSSRDGHSGRKKSEEEGLILSNELTGIDNVVRAISKAINNEQSRFERLLPFLATVGSVAPFIGLFGTVWGIMNAFQGIAQTGTATLGAVAPGIAESLIATGVGIGAAIPAVMGYNYFAVKLKAARVEMDSFSSDFLNIIKRNFFAA